MKLTEIVYGFKWFLSGLLEKPLREFGKLWAKKTIRILVICSAALAFAVPLVVIVTAKISSDIKNKEAAPDYVFTPDPIAAEDLFIPEEPDFLPPVMLEQEQKEAWSTEDASKFWTDPGEFPREFWIGRISASIDRLLEPLP
ncbi:MAG: hypothetical protein LBP37_03125 [Spirochaetaceae bacterium]|jgi:hypothetical protein|nr:hypothetical protein [Spirochaetaceae bacterium]